MGTTYYPDPQADTPRGSARIQIDSTTNASPIKVKTTVNHGYGAGDRVEIEGADDPGAAGVWNITIVDADEFTLDGSVGTLVGGAVGTVSNFTILPSATIPSDGDLVDATNANTPVENALNLGAYPGIVNARWRIVDVYNARLDDSTPVANTTWSATTPSTAAWSWAQNSPVWIPGVGEAPGVAPIFIDGDFIDIEFSTTLAYTSAGVNAGIAIAISDDNTNIFPLKGSAMVLPAAGLTNACLVLSGRVYATDFSPAFVAPGHVFSVGIALYGNVAGPAVTLSGAYSFVMKHYRPNG